ncbi:MAG: hypothetical protein ACRDSZ_12910 [Pseudonocardiaceae bacterium]
MLLHACDPDDPGHHWWELPGGGVDPGETMSSSHEPVWSRQSGAPDSPKTNEQACSVSDGGITPTCLTATTSWRAHPTRHAL